MRILIADNDIEHRANLIKILEEQAHKVEEAITLGEITNKCKSKCPDLLIIDSDLPGMKGEDVVRAVRQLGGDAAWNPIILIGNSPSLDALTQGIDAGADDFLAKPINTISLQYRIASAQRLLTLKEDVFTIAHELVLANHALEVGVTQDSMTGMLDIQSFHKALENEWYKAKKTNTNLAMLLLNLDNFRGYNDKYGSQLGDECIKKVSTALKKEIPKNYKIFARTIGDNFALLMPNTDKKMALEVANKLHKAVDDLKIPHAASHFSDHVTSSVGISSTEGSEQKNPLELMESCDFALYQAKHKGRNKIYSELAVVQN